VKHSNQLPYIDNAETLSAEFRRLYSQRIACKNKLGRPPAPALTLQQRLQVLAKTEGRCHVCGVDLNVEDFEADHVQPHSTGGVGDISNFLAACHHCNNYRWDYLPEELQWILKLGIWMKTQIEFETAIGVSTANQFAEHEIQRERRRKNPRKPYVLDGTQFPVRKSKFVK
jgi:hypothetical protein